MYLRSLIIIGLALMMGCKDKPKVIEATDMTIGNHNFDNTNDMNSMSKLENAKFTKVDVLEVLQATQYTYMRVSNGKIKYWIAVGKMEAKPGDVFYTAGEVLQLNFKSTEFKRTFDTLYLVNSVLNNYHQKASALPAEKSEDVKISANKNKVNGAISLDELIKNKEKFKGQTVVVAGECIKANNGILGKNWIHIKDGSKINGKQADLTISTREDIKAGSFVSLKGKISLNKDLGYGYVYEVLMEDATKQ